MKQSFFLSLVCLGFVASCETPEKLTKTKPKEEVIFMYHPKWQPPSSREWQFKDKKAPKKIVAVFLESSQYSSDMNAKVFEGLSSKIEISGCNERNKKSKYVDTMEFFPLFPVKDAWLNSASIVLKDPAIETCEIENIEMIFEFKHFIGNPPGQFGGKWGIQSFKTEFSPLGQSKVNLFAKYLLENQD